METVSMLQGHLVENIQNPVLPQGSRLPKTDSNLCLEPLQNVQTLGNISAIGVGIFVPSALDAIGVETATIGVETCIPMPKEAGVEIGVGICYWR